MPTLEWIGKDKVVNHHLDVPYRVLERQYSYDADGQHEADNGSENMIIHGDNLEALKSLLPLYEGRVKCIYIDPPYNTAKSKNSKQAWVYNDNVDHPKIQKWLGSVVGDADEDLCRHDKWLCMMYPRLKLLYKLLSPFGAIMISIDDNEYANLKSICDEIFGESNHLTTFVWYSEGHTDNQDDITNVHEYILCYAKNKNSVTIQRVVDPNTPEDSKILRDFAENSITKNGPKNPPSAVILPAGFPCEVENLSLNASGNGIRFVEAAKAKGYIDRAITKEYEMSYPVRLDDMIVENGVLVKPCRVFSGWSSHDKLCAFIDNGCQPIDDKGTKLRFYLSKNGVIYYYRYGRESHYIQTVLRNMGTTETSKYMLEKMDVVFDYPKPVSLVSYLISMFAGENDIIIDSFAGSATTAHAVLANNKEKRTAQKFILIEMEEYANEKTAKRVKCVISGYGEKKDRVAGTGGSFSYYELGEPLLIDGNLNEKVGADRIREYVWFTDTKSRLPEAHPEEPYYLGIHVNSAYYFYYEQQAVTTLNREFLHTVKTKADAYVIYADLCTLSDAELERFHITFKKIPRDITKL